MSLRPQALAHENDRNKEQKPKHGGLLQLAQNAIHISNPPTGTLADADATCIGEGHFVKVAK